MCARDPFPKLPLKPVAISVEQHFAIQHMALIRSRLAQRRFIIDFNDGAASNERFGLDVPEDPKHSQVHMHQCCESRMDKTWNRLWLV
jgi:hypothetical protein